MEINIENSDVSENSKISRSLDLQSLYAEKKSLVSAPKEGGEDRALNRKRRRSLPDSEESWLGRGKRRKKCRKEVSLSSLEPVANGDSRKSSNAVDDAPGLNLGVPNSNKSRLKVHRLPSDKKNPIKKKNCEASVYGNLQKLSSLSNISYSLDGNIPIPKRARGFLRRKKFQSNHISKQAGTSSSKLATGSLSTPTRRVCSDDLLVKLTEDPITPFFSSEGKRKKVNSSSRANSVRCCKVKDDGLIRSNGDPTLKRAHRNCGKRRKSAPQEQNLAEEAELLVDNSSKICKDLQEDDEENLEQNAARMLSSRFDPSCTGFTANNTVSESQSMIGPLLPLFHRNLASPEANHSAGSQSTSADAAGRVLRPRKQHKEKGLGTGRRRRHFYEIFCRDLDAYWVLHRRIKVFWPLDQSWYFGLVNDYDPERKLHHVKYDDRDEEWINLQNERFKLLLLPSEVPGKSGSVKAELTEKLELGGNHVAERNGKMDCEDDYCSSGNMDSEPIISWLARSTHRVKSSPLGIIKKQKRPCVPKNFGVSMLSKVSDSGIQGCLVAGPSRTDIDELSSKPLVLDRSTDGDMPGKSTMMESTICSKDRKLPYVYFRRRFHKKWQGLGCISKESSGCRSIAGSVTSRASVADRIGIAEEYDVARQSSGLKCLRHMDQNCVLWCCKNLGLLSLAGTLMELEQVKLKLCRPLQWVHSLMLGAENVWLYRTLLLIQHGMVVSVSPMVHLELLFVDNVVGLRFLLFEGCLMQAVAFICLILATFHQPNEYGKFVCLQLPVTSISFKLSKFQNLGRRLVFVLYNFLEVKNSKWLYLDAKLKQYCLVTKQLPLAECTYDNIRTLQSGTDELPIPPVCEEPLSLQGSRKRSRQGLMHMGISKELVNMNISLSSSNFDEKHRRLPPFVLSFAAAPTFFNSLHLRLLMENNMASVSLQNHDLMSFLEGPENCGRSMDGDCITVGKFSNQVSEITLGNMRRSLSQAAAGSGCMSFAKSKVETDALSVSNDGDWKYLNSELNVTGTSVGLQDSEKNETNGIVQPQRRQCQHSGSEQCAGRSWSSVSEGHSSPNKSGTGCFSCLNDSNDQSVPLNQVESQTFDSGTWSVQHCASDLAWNMNDGTIRSPNPTAPRSVWHRNRNSTGSTSFGYRSNMWPNRREDRVCNDFGNGSRKPRTQVSYLLPFEGHEFGSKPRSNHRKGRPYKRIKTVDEKRMSGGSRSPLRRPEILSCDVNILITEGDRGWRECGAQVVLEFVDHKDWRLLVKLMGSTKYSYKAHQFLQPGTTNRYTHAMMWKGGKDWILEFPDRNQWPLFKDMHEECYNRNVRAASVKNIPIPGVRLIESDDNAIEVPFLRSSPKYFQQVENDADMAIDPSRVLYDMDSDDEEWITIQRNSSNNESKPLEISEEMFERIIDMFEKVAYAEQRDNFTGDEIEELMIGMGSMDIINAIHNHWRQKRQKKGLPLIRQFQPPLWEKYQQQVREWEVAMNTSHSLPNGCKEKVALIEKPPMFAFCLRPRGLEVSLPNKVSKQRPHRKFPAGGHNSSSSRDQNGFQVFGRRLNGLAVGEERAIYTDQDHNSFDASPWLQTSTRVLSPRDAISTGYLSMSSDGSERNQHRKFIRNESNKAGMFPSDSQMVAMSYNQRAGKRNGVCRQNIELPDYSSQKHYQPQGSQRYKIEQLGGSDFDEFRLRDASSAAQHASNMAKLKREKAQRLLYRADVAIHKAAVALMTADAIKASSEKHTADDG